MRHGPGQAVGVLRIGSPLDYTILAVQGRVQERPATTDDALGLTRRASLRSQLYRRCFTHVRICIAQASKRSSHAVTSCDPTTSSSALQPAQSATLVLCAADARIMTSGPRRGRRSHHIFDLHRLHVFRWPKLMFLHVLHRLRSQEHDADRRPRQQSGG
jgi:hypothetical protein